MGYERVSEAIRECVESLVDAGASRAMVELHVAPLEMVAVQSIAAAQRDQLLLNLEIRSAVLAERFGVDERTVRKWRNAALNRPERAGNRAAKAG